MIAYALVCRIDGQLMSIGGTPGVLLKVGRLVQPIASDLEVLVSNYGPTVPEIDRLPFKEFEDVCEKALKAGQDLHSVGALDPSPAPANRGLSSPGDSPAR